MIIEKARIDDLPWIVSELEKFDKAGNRKLSVRGDKWEQGIIELINNHVFLVAWSGARKAGLIGGGLAPHPFNSQITVLSEFFWWVSPEFRGSRAGLMLLNEFVRIGRERADWVNITLEHNSPVKDKCLTARGFSMTEKSYLLEVA